MPLPTPVFRGKVKPGPRLKAYDRTALGAWLSALVGEDVDLIVRKRRSKASNAQRRWLFGVALNLLGDHFGYDRHEREELRTDLLGLYGGWATTPLGRQVPALGGFSKIDTATMSAFMEWLPRWAMTEHNVYIPLPDDPAWEAIAEADERAA